MKILFIGGTGNISSTLSKLVVGPLFGFGAGLMIDTFGPRRLMIAGIVMAGGALIGLASVSTLTGFYFFYFYFSPNPASLERSSLRPRCSRERTVPSEQRIVSLISS